MLKAWLVSLAFLLPLLPLQAQTRPPLPEGITAVTAVEGVSEYRLANGLQILLVQDDSKPTTTVNVTYRVGSRHESYGEKGMAHLLEHLVFKGTPTTRNALAEFSRRGLRANGTTSLDRTNYFASFAADDERLRWYLSWQADAMVNSFIAKEDLASEMTVVRNEMEIGENNPGRVLLQRTLATMYDWHNYGKATIGARSDVENVDISRLQAFYRKYYQPDNATLIVAGRFDTAQTLEWIAQYFGKLPRPQRVLEPTYTLDPAQDGERSITVRRNGGAPTVYVGFHGPAGAHPDAVAMDALSIILGDTPSGRLHRRLVEQQLAASTFASFWGSAEPSPFFVGAQLAPGQDLAAARAAILDTVDALSTEPVTKEELERARTQYLADWELGFTDPERVGVALSGAIAVGDWRLFFLERDRMRALTLDDVQRVAGRYLVRDNRTIATYLPTERPARGPEPARVDIAPMVAGYKGDPAAQQAEAFDATPANLDARTRTFQLPSGMKGAMLTKGTRGGAVQLRLRLNHGDLQSLKGLETVGQFTARMLDKGAGGLSRQQIADRFDQLRAQVQISGLDQGVQVSVTTTRANAPGVVELLGLLLRDPAFPPAALEELRRQALTAIESSRKEPTARISQVLARHGNPYPRGDLRYAPTFEEQAEDVAAVTAPQLREYHRRFYSAAHAEFAAVGDFDADAVRRALDKAFGDWKQPAGGPLPFVRVPQPLVPVPPARFVEITPDRQNANLQFVLPLPLSDLHPDYPALHTANYIFGLNTDSRLWRRIREQEGLSYDVRSYVDWTPYPEDHSTWVGSAAFAPQNLPRVEAALKEEAARSLRDGFTQAELDQGRQALLNLRRLNRAQDAVIASTLLSNLRLNRTFEISQRVDDAIGKLTLEQINAVWRKYAMPDRWALAVGGDFKQP